jgi:hypothetical protein
MKQLFLNRHCIRFFRLIAVLSFFSITGCAEFNSGWNQSSPRNSDYYASTDFDELLVFGENMARMPPSARSKQCRSLQKRQKTLSRTGIVLHLMVGRLLSEGCGDISKILFELNAIPFGTLDARTRRLVAINTEALKRIGSSRKSSSPDCKQRSNPSEAESKLIKGSNKNDARMLREKLEAIRSMEKQIDDDGGAQ